MQQFLESAPPSVSSAWSSAVRVPGPPSETPAPPLSDSHEGPIAVMKAPAPGALLRAVQGSAASDLQSLMDMTENSSHYDEDLSSGDESFYEREFPDPRVPGSLWMAESPAEAPWEGQVGLMKLSLEFLPTEGPPPPHGPSLIGDIHEYLLVSSVADELGGPRNERVKELLDSREHPPAWMTLEPSSDIIEWKEVLEAVRGMDERAIQAFVRVLKSPGGHSGFYEANRILFHLLKDTTSASTSSGRVGPWMQRATTEALEAISNYLEWDAEHQRGLGKVWTSYEGPRRQTLGFWAARPSTQGHSSSSGGRGRWADDTPWRNFRRS